MADEEGNLEPKMRELVKSLTGKDIMDANGNFKSTYEIMKELGSVYDTLTDKQRAYLAETVAGKQRANIFASIMQNSQQLEKVYDTATKSAGSASKEQEAYMNSMSGKINALKENFKGMFIDTINSEALKEVIDIANGGITVFRELGNQFGSLPVLISTVVASLNVFSTKFNESFMGQLPILKQMNSFFDSWKASIKADTVATSANTVAKESNNVASSSSIVNSKGETISTVANTGAKVANTTATVASTVATGAMTVAVSALQAVMSFGLSLAVTGIISGIIKLGDSLVTTKAELKEFNEETSKSVSETQKSVSSAEEYVKKIEKLNDTISSTGDAEKKKELVEQLTEAQKGLAEAMPEATNDVSDNGENLATSIEFTKEIIQLKKDEMKINAQKFFDENKGLLSDIDELEQKKQKLKEYQTVLAQGKNTVKQKFDTIENGQTVSKEYDVRIKPDDVKKLNEEIMETTKTASQARVMARYLGDDTTDEQKKMIHGIDEYTNKLKQNTQEKQNNAKTKTNTDNSPSGNPNNINVLSEAIKELNSTSNLSENSIKKLASVMPNLDISNMSAKEKVEALSKALKDQKDQMDKNAMTDAKKGQQDFVAQEEGIEKINQYLKEMQKNGSMSADIMKELATSDLFSDFTGDLTNMASVQEYFNGKIVNMRAIQQSAYSQMMGNSQAYYKTQLANGNNLQDAFNQWASNFVNINDSSYGFDVRNYNTMNEAKSGMMNSMADAMGKYLANLVGGSADAYSADLKSCKNWGEMKTKVIGKIDEDIQRLNNNVILGSQIMSALTKFDGTMWDGPAGEAKFKKAQEVQAQAKAEIERLQAQRQKIEADFNNIDAKFGGNFTPPTFDSNSYKGTDYKGSGSGSHGSSGSDTQKTINRITIETDRYLDLENAVKKVNKAIELNDTEAENKTGQEKIRILQEQINLYNQLRSVQGNLKNAEISRLNELKSSLSQQGFSFNGDDLVNSNNRLIALQNWYNGQMTGDNQEQIRSQFEAIKKNVEEYLSLITDKIPEVTKDITDISNKIISEQKSIAEEMQKVRDEFIKAEESKTEAVKKELEKRRKALEDEKNKEDKADELGEKQKSLNDLQQKYSEVLKTGDAEQIKQARKNIEDNQRELNKYERDKNFEEGTKRLEDDEAYIEEESKSKIDNINKQLSDDNILKLVQQGVTNIDDMLRNVKANTADITTPVYTVESVLRNNILPLTEQMSKNALNAVATLRSGLVNGNIGIDSNMTVTSKGSQPTNINIKQGDTIIQGSITEEVLPKVEAMIEERDEKFEKFRNDVIEAVRVN